MKKNPRRSNNRNKEREEFDRQILDLARVTRVTKGGKQLSFRACVVLGDKNGRVGMGLSKGKDVQIAVDKAVKQAKKNIIHVPVMKDTIPHIVETKFKAAKILLKPAPTGSGVIAGGSVRVILELAGVPNISAKILGKTKNKISIARATLKALQSFKNYQELVKKTKRPPLKIEENARSAFKKSYKPNDRKAPFKKFVKREPVIVSDKNKKIESTPATTSAKVVAVEKAVVEKKEDK